MTPNVRITRGTRPRPSARKAVEMDGVEICRQCIGSGGWHVTRDANNKKGTHLWNECSQCNGRGYVGHPEESS